MLGGRVACIHDLQGSALCVKSATLWDGGLLEKEFRIPQQNVLGRLCLSLPHYSIGSETPKKVLR